MISHQIYFYPGEGDARYLNSFPTNNIYPRFKVGIFSRIVTISPDEAALYEARGVVPCVWYSVLYSPHEGSATEKARHIQE